MSGVIVDGTGKNYKAKVDSDNHLQTKSIMLPRMGQESIVNGNAYTLEYFFKQQVADTAENAGYLTYTGVHSFILSKMYLTSYDANYTHVDLYMGTLTPSGGATSTIINLNTASSKTLAITSYHQNDGANLITTGALGTCIYSVALPNVCTYMLDFQDAFILRPQLLLNLRVTCKNANSLCRIFTTGYEIDLTK